MTDLGVVFRPELPPEQLRAVATAAEEAGLAELWLWEDCFKEGGIAAAAAALAWTDRLRVGIGLTQIGEFSFILAQVSLQAGLITPEVYHATLAASLLTILANVALFKLLKVTPALPGNHASALA